MNLVSFYGRPTVVYGMEEAAKCVKKAEQLKANARGPRPIYNSEHYVQATAAADAYLDMVTHDDFFEYTIEHFESGLHHNEKSLASILKKYSIGIYQVISPFEPFKKLLLEKTEKNCSKTLLPKVEKFMNNIAKLI